MNPSDCGNLTYKGYARIYTLNEDDTGKVEKLIKKMDSFEYEYYPHQLIVPVTSYPNVVYIGKFDLSPHIIEECKKNKYSDFYF